MRAAHATLCDPAGVETPVSVWTCGFGEYRRSAVPAGLVAVPAHMSYFRDGHREPPETQPLVHRLVINPFVFRLIFTSFATTRFASQTRLLGGDDWLFFNYGYEEDPRWALPLDDADEPHRFFIQLYHRTATQVDLAGKKVLEVQLRPRWRRLVSGAYAAARPPTPDWT